MKEKPLPPPPKSTPASSEQEEDQPKGHIKKLPSPPVSKTTSSARPAFKLPEIKRWHFYLLAGVVSLILAWIYLPKLYLELFYRKPTREWVVATFKENASKNFSNSSLLDFNIGSVEILRVEYGVSHIIITGTGVLRESLFTTITNTSDELLDKANVPIQDYRASLTDFKNLRDRTAVKVPDYSLFQFLKTVRSGKDECSFNIQFDAARSGVHWRLAKVSEKSISPDDFVWGFPRSHFPSNTVVIEEPNGVEKLREYGEQLNKFREDVNKARAKQAEQMAEEQKKRQQDSVPSIATAPAPQSTDTKTRSPIPKSSNYVNVYEFINADGSFDYKKAEQYLNDSYKQCLGKMQTKQQKELIRVPQRAWIEYTDKTEAANKAMGMDGSDVWSLSLIECVSRGNQLQHYYDYPNSNMDQLGADLNQAEEQLNSVYQQIISRLNESDKSNLIQAERAWVDYKEKNSRANASVTRTGNGMPATIIVVKRRIEELKAIYLSGH